MNIGEWVAIGIAAVVVVGAVAYVIWFTNGPLKEHLEDDE